MVGDHPLGGDDDQAVDVTRQLGHPAGAGRRGGVGDGVEYGRDDCRPHGAADELLRGLAGGDQSQDEDCAAFKT